ncbi:MAG TPA: PQQ-binding-like beta-propeller repeat protein [Candidatus Eremiobacteraceae bacterium]|nr:PQQ-binding-like beta-propeller repeat protein [Candidatus Eremiobacteraceae bacterium]
MHRHCLRSALPLLVIILCAATAAQAAAAPAGAQARAIGRLRATQAAPWPWMQAAPKPRSAPVLYPIDESSDAVVVGNTFPGSRIDIYADGNWLASGIANGYAARIFLPRLLSPGERVAATERTAVGPLISQAVAVNMDYTTYHFNNFRTGWDAFETTLTTANVASSSFGPLYTLNVDGEVLAQPLYVQQVVMPGIGTHDTLFTVTENDTAYAFDAETGAPLWTTSLANAANGDSPMPTRNTGNCLNIVPAIGVTSTPVIDVTTRTMYLVAKIKHLHFGVPSYFLMLHALDIRTGLDKPGSPIAITATYPVKGEAPLVFDAKREHQRPGLLLSRGVLYIGFGSYCDLFGPDAHGWLIAYSADTLSQLAVFNGSPNRTEGFASIWAGGFAPAADFQGNVYAVTGNGAFDGTANFGDSVLRLAANTLHVHDFFTPYNQADLDAKDFDLGSGGVMVIPSQAQGDPQLLVTAGKGKTLYLMDSASMGGFTPGGPDNVVEAIPDAVGQKLGVEGGPAYYVTPTGTPYIYYGGGQDFLKAWALSYQPKPSLSMISQSKTTLSGEGGTIPVVSSNLEVPGTGIVWVVDRPQQGGSNHNVGLEAYDATNLKKKLFATVVGVFGNPKGNLYSVPTVVNGRVYVSDGNQIVVYGLH